MAVPGVRLNTVQAALLRSLVADWDRHAMDGSLPLAGEMGGGDRRRSQPSVAALVRRGLVEVCGEHVYGGPRVMPTQAGRAALAATTARQARQTGPVVSPRRPPATPGTASSRATETPFF